MNAYKLKADLLSTKYGKIAEEFKVHHDDRLLVYNILHQLLDACKAMEGIQNTYICVAINTQFRDDEATMNEIVERFTDSVYLSNGRWVKKPQTA